jgi:enoyl-CoA hydratase/carnithine racemase
MMSKLAIALYDAEAARVVVVTGRAMRAFSGSVEVADHSRVRVGESTDDFSRLLRERQNFSRPTIAALDSSTLWVGGDPIDATDAYRLGLVNQLARMRPKVSTPLPPNARQTGNIDDSHRICC